MFTHQIDFDAMPFGLAQGRLENERGSKWIMKNNLRRLITKEHVSHGRNEIQWPARLSKSPTARSFFQAALLGHIEPDRSKCRRSREDYGRCVRIAYDVPLLVDVLGKETPASIIKPLSKAGMPGSMAKSNPMLVSGLIVRTVTSPG